MSIGFLRDIFHVNSAADAIVWRDNVRTYQQLLRRVDENAARLTESGVSSGAVVALEADFSPGAIAMFLALAERGCILVPLTRGAARQTDLLETSETEYLLQTDDADNVEIQPAQRKATHPLYEQLRQQRRPGLVLFSSGSTGKCKAALHDMALLLEKFKTRRSALRTISFLMFDHIGGVNTMLHTLSNGGCLVAPADRSPDGVLSAVARNAVELLPTSPTFLNLMLLTEAYRRHALDSLRIISYGTEPMPHSTLSRLHQLFPHIELRQTYGLSELGILRSKSRGNDSLWVKLGGEGFQTRVVDGILYIKSRSAMLGYLNAPSPFTADGWLVTGDMVEQDGEYFHILGRDSEVINVGGQKVFPAEVESVITDMENVADAVVFGEPNAITGQIVCARVSLRQNEDRGAFSKALKSHCRTYLEEFKVPVRVVVEEDLDCTGRMKKCRPAVADVGERGPSGP